MTCFLLSAGKVSHLWKSVLTVLYRFLRLLYRRWLNITNFVSLRNATFYLARDKSVIPQADKSSGIYQNTGLASSCPRARPICIIYMVGQVWRKHCAVQYSLCNWPLLNSCSFPMTCLILSLLDKPHNALQARARIQSASTNGVFTISKESRTLMPLLALTHPHILDKMSSLLLKAGLDFDWNFATAPVICKQWRQK